ncbi:2-dehydropantoate 2-reductase N-terminal domain-containing protein [Vibrio sp.]|uniref:2-dehydropantoate 2-reductase N-terminal domain-containing protein n=1 Tax=Vibrio sp. TaxID=678 RepID=UPI003D0C9C12
MRMPSRVMNIGIIGSGYVGTVTGAGLAELGNEVTFVDFDHERVAALNRGESPIFEPGLSDLLVKTRGRYHATTDYGETLSFTERT